MHNRLGALETAVEDAVDNGSLPECAKMKRDIVFRAHLDVFHRAVLGDRLSRVEPTAVQFQPGEMVMRTKPPPECNCLPWNASGSCRDCRSAVATTSGASRLSIRLQAATSSASR